MGTEFKGKKVLFEKASDDRKTRSKIRSFARSLALDVYNRSAEGSHISSNALELIKALEKNELKENPSPLAEVLFAKRHTPTQEAPQRTSTPMPRVVDQPHFFQATPPTPRADAGESKEEAKRPVGP